MSTSRFYDGAGRHIDLLQKRNRELRDSLVEAVRLLRRYLAGTEVDRAAAEETTNDCAAVANMAGIGRRAA